MSDFTRGLGYLPDVPSPADDLYALALGDGAEKEEVDLLKKFPSCWRNISEDQGSTNACVGMSTGTFIEHMHARQTGRLAEFSHAFAYHIARIPAGWTRFDRGTFIRDAFQMLSTAGICLESWHPLRLASGRYNVLSTPIAEAFEQAKRHRLVNARRLNRHQVLDCLSDDQLVVAGITCFNHTIFSRHAQETGEIIMPRKFSDPAGGHAIVLAGYSKPLGKIWGPNSWGSRTWGRNNQHRAGWFEMSLDYIFRSDLSQDFWTADFIEETTVHA